MKEAAKVVSSSIIGADFKLIDVGSQTYVLKPPTIRRMAGAINALCGIDVSDAPTLRELFLSFKDAEAYSKALSWLINEDESLVEELNKAPIEEVIDGVIAGFDMTGQSFMKAVGLLKSVRKLAAREHQ